MKQPVRGAGKVKKSKPRYTSRGPFARRGKPKNVKYGTSKLEADFAHDFLERMNLTYVYQWEAKDIKRFFDFAVTAYDNVDYDWELKEGVRSVKTGDGKPFIPSVLIEVDGSYYHGDPRIVGDKGLNPMQKHNKFVDSLKDRWWEMHCIPLVRIWEYDIRNNPSEVIERLKRYVSEGQKKRRIDEAKRRPH